MLLKKALRLLDDECVKLVSRQDACYFKSNSSSEEKKNNRLP